LYVEKLKLISIKIQVEAELGEDDVEIDIDDLSVDNDFDDLGNDDLLGISYKKIVNGFILITVYIDNEEDAELEAQIAKELDDDQ